MVSKKSLPKQLFLGSCKRMHFTEKGGINQAVKSGDQGSAQGRGLGNSQGEERKTVILAAQQTHRATSLDCGRRPEGLQEEPIAPRENGTL